MTSRPDGGEASISSVVGAVVLVVDQDPAVHRGVAELLGEAGLHVTCVADLTAAMTQVERSFFSVILVDLDTPKPGAGIATIAALAERTPTSMILALTPRRSFDDGVAAVRAGAIDLVLKAPESVAYLRERVLDAAGRSVGKRRRDDVLGEVRAIHDEFLRQFMDAERRALDLADRLSGRDPARLTEPEPLVVLIVDEVDSFADALIEAAPAGFVFPHATSGGEAIDRLTSGTVHYAMVSDDLHDLPASMVIRAARAQAPDTVVLAFRGPGPGGYVHLVEAAGQRPFLTRFEDPGQMLDRLDELAAAFRARWRERRYVQNFRERHYDFLRRYVELKTKIERSIDDGSA